MATNVAGSTIIPEELSHWGGQMAIFRGIIAILFGIGAIAMPGITLLLLIVLFSIYAFVDGIIALISAFRMAARHDPWLGLLFLGIVGIAVGIIGFRAPGLTALSLLYVIAAWAIVTGILELVSAFELRKQIRGEWLLALSGTLSIILGFLLAAMPIIGLASLVLMVGIYAIADGIVLLYLGAKLRSVDRARIGTPVAVR